MIKFVKLSLVLAMCWIMVKPAVAEAGSGKKAIPGALMYVYEYRNGKRPSSKMDPLAVVVDRSELFSARNLYQFPDTQVFAEQSVFLVWRGYVNIPIKGEYTMVLSYGENHRDVDSSVVLRINGGDFFKIWKKGDKKIGNDSKTLILKRGDYEFIFISEHPGYAVNVPPFTLTMWNRKNPLERISVTPASLCHAE